MQRGGMGISTFFRFSVFPGRARAVPGRAFSRSPLAELGTVDAVMADNGAVGSLGVRIEIFLMGEEGQVIDMGIFLVFCF